MFIYNYNSRSTQQTPKRHHPSAFFPDHSRRKERRKNGYVYINVRHLPCEGIQTTPNRLPTAIALSTFVSSTSTPVVPLRGRVPPSRRSTRQTPRTLEWPETSPFATCSFQLLLFVIISIIEEMDGI